MRSLVVRGARQHNLRGFTLALPHGALIVLTGPSGSGKSSLAFDTIYAEGQRRYIESLSTYAKQFLERMPRPAVDAIEGIAPAVAIEQLWNPKGIFPVLWKIKEKYYILYFLK